MKLSPLMALRRDRLTVLVVMIMCTTVATGEEDKNGDPSRDKPGGGTFVVVTFNTGTTPGLRHDDPPADGYTSAEAKISDRWYGNGLAWSPAVQAVRRFIEKVDPDIVAFQEMFYGKDCGEIPREARAGFVCETWSTGDPTVAEMVLGDQYQIAFHPGKPNKCVAVHRRFGRFRGCRDKICPEGLAGFPLKGCGSGVRVARAIIERTSGEQLTLVSIHGTSGLSREDQQCRVRQVEQIFVDFGDGAPAANGQQNLILGDFNTDPGRAAGVDASAVRWNDFVAQNKRFHFISRVGADAPRAYRGFVDIDHIVSDVFSGSCHYPGVDPGTQPVFDGTYFDHVPVVGTISEVPDE